MLCECNVVQVAMSDSVRVQCRFRRMSDIARVECRFRSMSNVFLRVAALSQQRTPLSMGKIQRFFLFLFLFSCGYVQPATDPAGRVNFNVCFLFFPLLFPFLFRVGARSAGIQPHCR